MAEILPANGNGKYPDWRWIVGFAGAALIVCLGVVGAMGGILYNGVQKQIADGAHDLDDAIHDRNSKIGDLDNRLSDLIQRETERNNRIERELGEIDATQTARTDIVRRLEEDIIRLWEITVRQDEELAKLRERLSSVEAKP